MEGPGRRGNIFCACDSPDDQSLLRSDTARWMGLKMWARDTPFARSLDNLGRCGEAVGTLPQGPLGVTFSCTPIVGNSIIADSGVVFFKAGRGASASEIGAGSPDFRFFHHAMGMACTPDAPRINSAAKK